MNLAALLMDVARREPARPAITDGDATLTYAAFWERVSRIGGALRAAGFVRGDRIVLWMENSAAFFECLYASWTAGLCAVPVNAKLHPREVAHILKDAQVRLLIVTPGLLADAHVAATVAGGSASVICAHSDEYERLASSEPAAPDDVFPDDLAWLFYTSGTTGRSKGAMLSHRNLLFMSLAYMADIDRVGRDDTKLHAAPLSHASGLYALPFFLNGAHHVVLRGFDIDLVSDALERYRNVTLFAAPTMLTRLVNDPRGSQLLTEHLKTLYYGGGPMYVADLTRALELFGPRLFQVYGQGEAPMTITGLQHSMHTVDGRPAPSERLASCGIARTGVQVRIVDEQDRELPRGEVGEVVTRSDCVMRGYWNNPDATAAALRGGWLHTGDLASFDEHGFLTLRDRSKDMIISGGSNIYPREIEEVLLQHPAVTEVSVVGRPHAEWGEEVVAFVVAPSDRTPLLAELDALCLDHIARFKRPKAYRFVEALPKNNYGKVLKTELRQQLERERPA